jgi:Raf kinase inhibitor-like YbhB/YbcL family protein
MNCVKTSFLASKSPTLSAFTLALGIFTACSSTNSDSGVMGTGGSASDAATTGSGGSTVVADAALLDATAPPDGPATLTLTSPAFADGQMIPAQNTCAGADTSPSLDWTAGPPATMSYALVLTDLTNNFVHWVLWDIPAATRALPAMLANDAMPAIPAGASQVNLDTPAAGAGNGYHGPCPSGNLHNYQFAIHAMDVLPLPDAITTWMSADVKSVVLMHSIAHGDLNGTSNATGP